jgi:hypothetical protein
MEYFVTCPACKRPGRRVTKDGLIFKHAKWLKKWSGAITPVCPGSGKSALREKKPQP